MCFGLPIVVSDRVGASGDLVREGGNGYVFPAYDIGALVDRLECVLAEDGAREMMGRMSRQIIEAWSYEEDVSALKAALHAVVSGGSRSSVASGVSVAPSTRGRP
jgi:glycosyltransferase involved in cell wall biosynthesis